MKIAPPELSDEAVLKTVIRSLGGYICSFGDYFDLYTINGRRITVQHGKSQFDVLLDEFASMRTNLCREIGLTERERLL